MSEGPLYFRLAHLQRLTARAKIAREVPTFSTVLAEAVALLEVVQAHKSTPGSLEWKRDRLHTMLRALNGLSYRLQHCRSWPEVEALLDAAVVRRKAEVPNPSR